MIKEYQISEDFKIAVNIALDNFNESNDSRGSYNLEIFRFRLLSFLFAIQELEFPSSFDENERLYVCELSKNYGLMYETKG
jgi:hypothetical protein